MDELIKKYVMPRPINFIRLKDNQGVVDTGDLTKDEAWAIAEEIKNNFIDHWNIKIIKK